MATGATPATKLLDQAKVAHLVHRYQHDPRSDSFGTEAVDALAGDLGIEAAQVFKTLIVELSDGRLAVAVLPVPDKLSLKAAAAALGVAKAVMADPAKAQRSSGYVTGGISPLGQRRTLATVIDASALTWERVFCSAGRRGLEIGLAPADLIRLTDAVTAPITAG
ncbi:Cys-tRNA(Pro) deacylase [Aldersonia sp. NBC_00410]|uniref:Cys-tRNA(Pro) deacylase n=1 Tax=Aldersonia sp. NBC_00410 TaxID=2975954 RepID=UPI00225B340E|nr:Cys-tRNA(Pro) deacylase [Aldersonia sp. NBC_00410]MCX5044563.1 Cys-tRNA(Pro) deacylase [Aldersonia sp. NBC_00410]